MAHITIPEWVGNPMPHGPEGVICRKAFLSMGRYVVCLQNIDGAVHLVPVEPDHTQSRIQGNDGAASTIT